MVLGIFKIALHFWDGDIFMWQTLEILNILYVLTLKQVFWKTKIFFKNLEYCSLIKSTTMIVRYFHT